MQADIKIDNLRKQFPVTDKFVYFNHAAVSPISNLSRGCMQTYLDEISSYGAANYPKSLLGIMGQTRSLGALLLHTQAENVFFVKSTTQGLGIAATGVKFEDGQNIVLVESEFPANLRPWMPLRRKGLEIRLVKQKAGRVLIDDLARAIDKNTKLLSVSYVQFLSGFRIDLAKVGQLCRDHDVLFVVDAIQGLGAFDLDVELCGIDFLSADAHKWLLGPEGIGLGYASKKARDNIEQVLEGWLSVDRPFDFFDIEQPLKPNANRYEEGAYNVSGLYGLCGCLELIDNVGLNEISNKIMELTDYLVQSLEKIEWQVLSPRECLSEKSGIILATKKGIDFNLLAEKLRSQNIIISIRNGSLRISPHAYNSLDEVDSLISCL
jgi:selenocysteine lyase/cysteine desulfurase